MTLFPGAQALGIAVSQRNLPSPLSVNWCRLVSPSVFSDVSLILFQHFITAGLYRHPAFQKYWDWSVKTTPFRKKELWEIHMYSSGLPVPAGRLHTQEPSHCPGTAHHTLASKPKSMKVEVKISPMDILGFQLGPSSFL